MTKLLGSIFKSLISYEEASIDKVIEVNIQEYIRLPVIDREDCLIVYGPTKKKQYDILLQKPIENSRNSAFNLLRAPDIETARSHFLLLKNTLLPLLQAIPQQILNISSLQSICDILRDNSTWTSAHVAAQKGYSQAFLHPKIAGLADSADIELKKTPLHLAVIREDIPMIKFLLELKVSIHALDVKGNSVFHFAAATNKNIIKLVTSLESNVLNAPNFAGKTPLHLACENNKPDCVKELLIAGADVNVAATHDSSLPIHSAINADSTLCAKEIIAMYPNQLNAEDMKHGGTPLHWATSREMINALVELGCIVNATNFKGSTALHNMVCNKLLPCVLALLSWGGDVSIQNSDGYTALHLASTPFIVQALMIFGADPEIKNAKGETVRHCISISNFKDKNLMLYYLHTVGASRCPIQSATCNDGCAPKRNFDGIPPDLNPTARIRTSYDEFLDDAMDGLSQSNMQAPGIGFEERKKGGRILCLDGGGMKGLVLIQLLVYISRIWNRPILDLFDWICGTSTGGILALAIAKGRDALYCQGLYFRMKDKVFVGQRPFDEKPLEDILKKEFGEESCMDDIKNVKVVVTGVLADRFPADLHLFRNYLSGEELLCIDQGLTGVPVFDPTQPPNKQLVWHAARASGAAPSYFKAFGRFIDGGLISNNPTLDIMTEIIEHNCALRAVNRKEEVEEIKVVLSLGTGKPPVSKVNAIDVFRPDCFFKTIQMAFGLSNMAKLLIDQATMADNRTVDRARAWCGMAGIKYMRLSPQLSLDVPLDETKDEILINMLWETLVFAKSKEDKIRQLIHKLSEGCSTSSSGQQEIAMDITA